MGDGRREATADDIDRALALYRTACALLLRAGGSRSSPVAVARARR